MSMYTMSESTLRFLFLGPLQFILPATLLITTPKKSFLRYVPIPFMVWAASQFMNPVLETNYVWGNCVGMMSIAAFQAINLLLLNPMDNSDLCHGLALQSKSFGARVYRASRLLLPTRAPNTPWQAKNTPSHPEYFARRGMEIPPRARFLLRQLTIAGWQYLVLDLIHTLTLQKVAEQENTQPNPELGVLGIYWAKWTEQTISSTVAWFIVTRIVVDVYYRFTSIFFVGLGIDSPLDFPPAFGRMADAYTLRGFWGKFWHQFHRRLFSALSCFFTCKVLSLPRPSILERYTNIFVVFFCSGALHLFLDVAQAVPARDSGAMLFLCSFPLGIMIEDGVQALWRGRRAFEDKGDPPLWRRILGFAWVVLWLAVTSPWYFEPISRRPKAVPLVPFSIVGQIGLSAVAAIVLIGGVALKLVFEVEV